MAQSPSNIMVTESITFDTHKGTLLMTVDKPYAALALLSQYAVEYGLEEKPEFHLTLLGYKQGQLLVNLLQRLDTDSRATLVNTFTQLVAQLDWRCIPQNEYYYLEKTYQFHNKPEETRATIIQVYELPGLIRLYEVLNTDLQLSLDEPFPHVTLYSSSSNHETSDVGIGITSEADFQSLGPTRLTV